MRGILLALAGCAGLIACCLPPVSAPALTALPGRPCLAPLPDGVDLEVRDVRLRHGVYTPAPTQAVPEPGVHRYRDVRGLRRSTRSARDVDRAPERHVPIRQQPRAGVRRLRHAAGPACLCRRPGVGRHPGGGKPGARHAASRGNGRLRGGPAGRLRTHGGRQRGPGVGTALRRRILHAGADSLGDDRGPGTADGGSGVSATGLARRGRAGRQGPGFARDACRATTPITNIPFRRRRSPAVTPSRQRARFRHGSHVIRVHAPAPNASTQPS